MRRASLLVYLDDFLVIVGNGGYFVLFFGEFLIVFVFVFFRESFGEEVFYRYRYRGEKVCGNERYYCISDVFYSCDLIIFDN